MFQQDEHTQIIAVIHVFGPQMLNSSIHSSKQQLFVVWALAVYAQNIALLLLHMALINSTIV